MILKRKKRKWCSRVQDHVRKAVFLLMPDEKFIHLLPRGIKVETEMLISQEAVVGRVTPAARPVRNTHGAEHGPRHLAKVHVQRVQPGRRPAGANPRTSLSRFLLQYVLTVSAPISVTRTPTVMRSYVWGTCWCIVQLAAIFLVPLRLVLVAAPFSGVQLSRRWREFPVIDCRPSKRDEVPHAPDAYEFFLGGCLPWRRGNTDPGVCVLRWTVWRDRSGKFGGDRRAHLGKWLVRARPELSSNSNVTQPLLPSVSAFPPLLFRCSPSWGCIVSDGFRDAWFRFGFSSERRFPWPLDIRRTGAAPRLGNSSLVFYLGRSPLFSVQAGTHNGRRSRRRQARRHISAVPYYFASRG